MNNQIIKLFVVILSAIFLLSSPALGGGKAKGKNKTNPPGWEQGEKTGWKGEDTPPGLTEEKLEKKQKTRVKDEETKAQKEGKKAKQETELKEEKAEQEAEIKKEKKREAEMKNEQEKLKSQSKKKKGQAAKK